jgi:hypothetical protein
LRLRWTQEASRDLIELAEDSPRRAAAVLAAVEWMVKVGFSLGRPVTDDLDERYWPVRRSVSTTTWRRTSWS